MLAKGNLLVAILLLLIVETGLAIPMLKLVTLFTSPQYVIKVQARGITWLLTCVYLELAGLVYCLCIAKITPVESLLLASASLFAFTGLRIALYSANWGKDRKSYPCDKLLCHFPLLIPFHFKFCCEFGAFALT